jgi:hypothetical protein
MLILSFLQGLILRNALRTQKNAKDKICVIALGNLRSEVIKLRNEALEKDKILLSLVDVGGLRLPKVLKNVIRLCFPREICEPLKSDCEYTRAWLR